MVKSIPSPDVIDPSKAKMRKMTKIFLYTLGFLFLIILVGLANPSKGSSISERVQIQPLYPQPQNVETGLNASASTDSTSLGTGFEQVVNDEEFIEEGYYIPLPAKLINYKDESSACKPIRLELIWCLNEDLKVQCETSENKKSEQTLANCIWVGKIACKEIYQRGMIEQYYKGKDCHSINGSTSDEFGLYTSPISFFSQEYAEKTVDDFNMFP